MGVGVDPTEVLGVAVELDLEASGIHLNNADVRAIREQFTRHVRMFPMRSEGLGLEPLHRSHTCGQVDAGGVVPLTRLEVLPGSGLDALPEDLAEIPRVCEVEQGKSGGPTQNRTGII